MAKELVTNIYTDGTDWEHTIIAAHHNFLICNILVASVHTHTVKNVPRGKGKSANPNSHHVPHLLPDQKHKPTAAKLHYAVLITALEIFFQAGKIPKEQLSEQGRRNKSVVSKWCLTSSAKPFHDSTCSDCTFKLRTQHKAGRIHQTLGLMGCYINRMCEHFLQLVKSCMGFHQW